MTGSTLVAVDASEYPTRWEDYIGQNKAKSLLRITAQSAKVRKDKLPHTLITGPGGTGKTALALLAANESGRDVTAISGKMTAGEARVLLTQMKAGEILFWDEFHLAVAGGKANAEWLLNWMQDGWLSGPAGAEEMPDVTLFAATTDAGKFEETILGRFDLRLALVDPSDDEALQICEITARRLFDVPNADLRMPDVETLKGVAYAAVNNPRRIKMVLSQLRDVTLATGDLDLATTLDLMDITEDGLDLPSQRYLLALLRKFPNGAGETLLKQYLNEPGGLRHIETLLNKRDLLVMTNRGRVLSTAGLKRARELEKVGL